EIVPRVIDVTLGSAAAADAAAVDGSESAAARSSVAVELTPLRETPLDSTPPLRLSGVIEYHAEGGRVVEIPFEQVVSIEPQRPIATGEAIVDGRLDEWGALKQGTALPREVG